MGRAPALAVVTVSRRAAAGPGAWTALGTTTASAVGSWTFADPTTAPPGGLEYQAAASGYTSDAFGVVVDLTAPAVTLSVASPSSERPPPVRVTAADPAPGLLPAAGPVYLDVDLNNDGDFTDTDPVTTWTETA